MAGGVGGFFVAGPVGAFAGGVAGGTGMDALTTEIESKIHGSAPNVPLIEKTFGELKIVDDAGGRVNVGKMPANVLEGKLTSALDSQKSTFTNMSAGVTKLQNAIANLVNSNKINHAKCAPMATAPLNQNSQDTKNDVPSEAKGIMTTMKIYLNYLKI